MFKAVLTVVILRERVSVDHIKCTEVEEFFALYDILPFAFHDFDAWPLVPPFLPDVSKHIWVGLNHDV